MVLAATWMDGRIGRSQEYISLITSSFLKQFCIHRTIEFKHTVFPLIEAPGFY